MRPSDEHQAMPTEPHLRPNLMSSARRGGNEDSILAKLEREPARRAQAGAGNGARLAWYGGAVVIALGLTATLAWLAAGQVAGAPTLEVAHADLAPLTLPFEAPAAPMATAVIVDAAPAPQVSTAEVLRPPAVPPLRLLPPAGARPAPATTPPPRVPARPRATAPRQAARMPKPPPPARTVDHQGDSDVALISAVIHHANGHAEAPDACLEEGCRPTPPR